MSYGNFLADLGKIIGVDQIEDDDRVCHLRINDQWNVDIEPSEDGESVHVYTVVCAMPLTEQGTLYERLLEANLFGQGTGGAAFAVDPEAGDVILCQKFGIETYTSASLETFIRQFINIAAHWHEELGEGHQLAQLLEEPPSDEPPAAWDSSFISNRG